MRKNTNRRFRKVKITLRNSQRKRTLAKFESTLIDLSTDIRDLFNLLEKALEKSSLQLAEYPFSARAKGLETNIIQTNFTSEVFNHFREHAFWGKYRRLIIRAKGYIILFKKLDKKGYPMNIRTNTVESILSQSQLVDLFNNKDSAEEPVLFFGYQVDKLGNYVNLQIVYIDDGKIVFSIDENDLEKLSGKTRALNKPNVDPKIDPDFGTGLTERKAD